MVAVREEPGRRVLPELITLIKNADWIIAWDEDLGHHYYLKNGDIAFSEDRILFVGKSYPGSANNVIDGRNLLVIPGFVNIHSHLSGGNIDKGIMDETGAPALYGHALYTHSSLLQWEDQYTGAAAVSALSELLMSGVTTTVDISQPYPEWMDLMVESGMRVVCAPGFRQAKWLPIGEHRVEYEWDEELGWKGLERALDFADRAAADTSGRISALIMPAQVDTCRGELIQAAYGEAQKRNLPFQIHAAQSMVEFYEILRRHGISPVQWLERLGVLGERTILGHCIYTDRHSWSPLKTDDDIPLLEQRSVTVAHCPTVFGRTGMTMETVGDYIHRGVRVGIGTDSFPYNMLEEIRHAAVYGRISKGSVFDVKTAELFTAATVGGARALGREDLGRLAPGAQADLVLVDTAHPLMRPLHDPLRNLIYVAAERAVRDVFVAGKMLVENGRVISMDYLSSHAREDEAQKQALEGVPSLDQHGRSIEEIAPRCFEVK